MRTGRARPQRSSVDRSSVSSTAVFHKTVWSWGKEIGFKCAREVNKVRQMERGCTAQCFYEGWNEWRSWKAVRCNRAITEWWETRVEQVKMWDLGGSETEASEITNTHMTAGKTGCLVCECECLCLCVSYNSPLFNRRHTIDLNAELWTR